MENKFTFQGHTFDEEKQVILAKKEAEAIAYLRSKTDFNNVNQLMKLYAQLKWRRLRSSTRKTPSTLILRHFRTLCDWSIIVCSRYKNLLH